jgi:hypothetical protein
MVKVVRGQDGLEKGEYLDPNTGMKFTIQVRKSTWNSIYFHF